MIQILLYSYLEAEHFGGNKVTAGVLQNPESVQQLVREQQAYEFLRNICGSPPYWQHELHDVLAMLCSIGIPTGS